MFQMPFGRPFPTLGLGAAVVVASLIPAAAALGAQAVKSPAPTVPRGFTITKLAAMPKSATNCDDLARLDGHLFVACQNMTQSTGGGGNSTIVEYADDGALLSTWSMPDKTDGLAGDPLHHRLIVTLDEDAHSHLATITPAAAAAQQIVNYRYSVDPASPTGTGPLHTGGGTDSVSVDSAGHIYIAASYGIAKTGTAVFRANLETPTAAATGSTGTVSLKPTFLDDAAAHSGSPTGPPVKLKLIDVDSSAIVPYTSPRFGGQFAIDDQTAMQLVFSSNIDAGTGLTSVKTPYGLDDVRWATTDGGSLYVVDKGPASSGASALYKVTGPFVAGAAFGANDSIPNQVVTINLANGKLTPFVQNLQTAKGLVYLDAAGAEPSLALGSSSTATPVATAPGKSSVAAPATTKTSGGSDTTLPTILAIVALVIALGAGALVLNRRRPLAS